MEDLERVEGRLEHIQTVEPILSALRTISLASWQMALNRRTALRRYRERLTGVLSVLLSHPLAVGHARRERRPGPAHIVAVVVGSERGLCGRFNTVVVERAERYLINEIDPDASVELVSLGTRVTRMLKRRQRTVDRSTKLSLAALPTHGLALDFAQRWLARYEAREITAVHLVHNEYHGMGRHRPQVTRLVPPMIPSREPVIPDSFPGRTEDKPWVPPIIETDPVSLYIRVIEQWTAIGLYGALIDSAAAEHSARYQLMEGATQNAERLIAELTMVVQTARQQAITREMQELAAGAGLIGPRSRQGNGSE